MTSSLLSRAASVVHVKSNKSCAIALASLVSTVPWNLWSKDLGWRRVSTQTTVHYRWQSKLLNSFQDFDFKRNRRHFDATKESGTGFETRLVPNAATGSIACASKWTAFRAAERCVGAGPTRIRLWSPDASLTTTRATFCRCVCVKLPSATTGQKPRHRLQRFCYLYCLLKLIKARPTTLDYRFLKAEQPRVIMKKKTLSGKYRFFLFSSKFPTSCETSSNIGVAAVATSLSPIVLLRRRQHFVELNPVCFTAILTPLLITNRLPKWTTMDPSKREIKTVWSPTRKNQIHGRKKFWPVFVVYIFMWNTCYYRPDRLKCLRLILMAFKKVKIFLFFK